MLDVSRYDTFVLDGVSQIGRESYRVAETLRSKHKVRRRKGGSYPLSHLYGHFGLVRLTRLGHDVPWTKA